MCEVCLNGTYPDCPVCGNDEEQEMKTAEAQCSFEVHVNCPHCDNQIDVFEQVKDCLDSDFAFDRGAYALSKDNISVLVKCDNKKCQEEFIVTKVNY